MSGTFLRWGIPALLTVVGGTAAAVATSGAAIPDDLTQRSLAELSSGERQWAQVHFDMQDAVVTGTALSPEAIDAVVSKVAAIKGVREVRSEASVVASISPYPFVATVRDGTVTISGAVPDDDARSRLLAVAGQGTTFDTKLLSGEGERDRWLVAAAYVVEQALKLDEGEVALSDLDLTMSGRARSQSDYQKLAETAVAPPPDGVTVKFREVEPPVASPFEFQANFDGKTLSVSGYVPDDQFILTLEALLPGGVTLNSSVQIASGQPADFARRALVLTQNLIRLREGKASLSDASSTLTGVPPDPKTAETVQTAVAVISADVSLEMPLIENYHFRATQKDGKLELDGYVPSESDLDALRALPDVEASGVAVGRGAPDRFADGLAFVLDSARGLSEGSVSLDGTVISMSGRAGTPEGYKAIQTSIGLGAPKGLMLGAVKVTQPTLADYRFSASKGPDGAVQLEGSMPSELIRRTLLAEVPGATDATGIADGAPDDFVDKARVALKALAGLKTGAISFEAGKWSFEGQADRADKATAARASLIGAGLESSAIRLSTSAPDVPTIAVYTWSATKAEDGTVTLSGYWPDDATRRGAVAALNGPVVDGGKPGFGAPANFSAEVVTALKALDLATSGSVALAGSNWTFDVTVPTAPDRQLVNTALGTLTADARWHVAIQASDEPPLVSPFTWSAEKSAEGSISLAGYVPDEGLRKELASSAGRLSKDTTLVGSGAPDGFAAHASAALKALSELESGRAGYDGNSWTISGTPSSLEARDAALAAIGVDASKEWTVALAEPPTPPPAEEPATEDAPVPSDEPAVAAVETPAETPAAEPAPDTPAAEAAQPAVETAAVAPEPTTPPAENTEVAVNISRPFLFDARKDAGEPIRFEGQVPEEPVRAHLAELSGTKPSEALSIASDLPGDFLPSAEAGTKALSLLSDGVFGLDGTQWVFAGRAEGEEQRRQAMAALSTAPAASGWQTSITLVPPLELCQIKVGAFAQRNAILFQSGSARLTPESEPALDELAGDLQACTEATVNVEGHTDSDGNPDANLALSVARAEAVVNELILRGVDPARLYAIGYGATLPIASNDTKAGKQANRRIAFTLTDE
jgi:outer membrane protein OmpA-like peptidoglycan-associated protein